VKHVVHNNWVQHRYHPAMQQVVPQRPHPLLTGAPAAGHWGAAFEPRCGLDLGSEQSVTADSVKGVELQRLCRATAATPCDPSPMVVVLMHSCWLHPIPVPDYSLGRE
jgi:hypothetical protein